MSRKSKIGVLIFLIISLVFGNVFAESIVLKSGKTVEGRLIEKTNKYIKIDFQGVLLTYFLDEIESIDGAKINSVVSNDINNQHSGITKENNISSTDLSADLTQNKEASFDLEKANEVYKEGLVFLQSGRIDEAISKLSEAILLSPISDLMSYLARGQAYALKNDYENAIGDFTKCIDGFGQPKDSLEVILPKDSRDVDLLALCYYCRARAYSNIAKWDKHDLAFLDVNKAILLKPYYAEAYELRGFLYYEAGDYDKAWLDVHKVESLGKQFLPRLLEELKKSSGRQK